MEQITLALYYPEDYTMTPFKKAEYLPLLPVGLHTYTLPDLRKLCVDSFPKSPTRNDIMKGFESVHGQLTASGVKGEIWVDGSFMTEKLDPEDIDFVLRMEADIYDKGEQTIRNAVDWLENDLKTPFHCDSYVFFEYDESHASYWEGEFNRAYWMKQFGFSRGEDYKGIAVIQV